MIDVITSIAAAPVATWLTVLLMTLLVLKELISAAGLGGRWKAFGHHLNIILVPLLVIFFVIVGVRIIAIPPI